MRFRLLASVLAVVLLAATVFGPLGCTSQDVGESEGSAEETATGGPPSEVVTYEDGHRFDQNGWVYVHIEGAPYDRGYQHGYLLAPELATILDSCEYLTYWNTGMTWDYFVESAEELWDGKIEDEYIQEMKGIADGATAAGTPMSWQEVLAWNGYEELTDYWWPTVLDEVYDKQVVESDEHCSAFIATGEYTEDGKIVVAHNSFNNFEMGQFSNVILDIEPDEGHAMFMQAAPGYIDSFADFFVTDARLIGTETTIGGFKRYDSTKEPEFSRVRNAMQYADDLDEFVTLMRKENNGGYANSWLLGDLETNEIMRFELGLEFFMVERTTDGCYIGFNAPLDPRIRNLECENTGYADIRRHQGARQVRLTELTEQHKGSIDVAIGQEILADHYDVYLKKDDNPSSRTIDGHYELDAREYMSQPGRPLPYQPRGAVDGKVMDTDMAESMSFTARWGNSSGMAFDAEEFLSEHIQWSHLDGYLIDRPSQPWTTFEAGQE